MELTYTEERAVKLLLIKSGKGVKKKDKSVSLYYIHYCEIISRASVKSENLVGEDHYHKPE